MVFKKSISQDASDCPVRFQNCYGTVITVYFPFVPFPNMPLYVAHKGGVRKILFSVHGSQRDSH